MNNNTIITKRTSKVVKASNLFSVKHDYLHAKVRHCFLYEMLVGIIYVSKRWCTYTVSAKRCRLPWKRFKHVFRLWTILTDRQDMIKIILWNLFNQLYIWNRLLLFFLFCKSIQIKLPMIWIIESMCSETGTAR